MPKGMYKRKAVNRKVRSPKRGVLHVAVVYGMQYQEQSTRNTGTWSCFVNKDKDVAVREALKAAEKWSNGSFGPYQVLVGELNERAKKPEIQFTTTPISIVEG